MFDAVTSNARDRGNPTVFELLLTDPTQPLTPSTRKLVARDFARVSHRRVRPWARLISLGAVALIRAVKQLIPGFIEEQLRWHHAIDVLCVWFIKNFMSADAGELLARHFILETNILAFIAQNCGKDVPAATLRPTTLEELGNHAVIEHDLAVYNLVIDVGHSGADVRTRRKRLDFSPLAVPPIDAQRERKRILELDIETALYFMNIPFCLFTTQTEYERAVNSFQLDESLCVMLAGLTGDATFRSWTPSKFPLWISVARDVPKELLFHAIVNEYAHTWLERMRDGEIER